MHIQPQEIVGMVTTTITIGNLVDEILAERGLMPAEEIRSLTIEKVLVNTGATRLCLPAGVIVQLGLPLAGEIDGVANAGDGYWGRIEGLFMRW
jgi:hypothetical protein